MSSVKMSISDISLDKNFSMRSPDLVTTGIRKRVSRTVKFFFGEDSNKLILKQSY